MVKKKQILTQAAATNRSWMCLLGWYSQKQRRIHEIVHGYDCPEIWWWATDGSLQNVTMVTEYRQSHPFDKDAVCKGFLCSSLRIETNVINQSINIG